MLVYLSHINYLKAILDSDKEHVRRYGTPLGCFVEDKIHKGNDPAAFLGENDKRNNWSKKRVIHVCGPLSLQLSSLDQFIFDRVNVKIILELAKPAFALMVEALNDNSIEQFRYNISDVKLLIKRVTPAPAAYLEVNKRLLSGKTKEYLFHRQLTHVENFGSGHSQMIITRPFESYIPPKLTIFFANQKACVGDYSLNPFFYPNCKLSQLKVVIDGVTVHDFSLKFPDEVSHIYYNSLMANNESSNFITYNNFLDGSTVYTFDLRASDARTDLFLEKSGNLQIKLYLEEPLTENMNLYILGDVLSTFGINNDRKVTTYYNY